MTWHGSSQPVYASQWVFCLEAGVELVEHAHTEACVLRRFSRVILLIVPGGDGVAGVDGTPNLEKPEHAS